MRKLSIDIETRSSVDLPNAGLYKYIEPSSFQVVLFAYAYDDEPVEIIDLTGASKAPVSLFEGPGLTDIPDTVLKDLTNKAVLKTAYNATFEIECLSKHLGIALDPSQWECTMVKGCMAGWPEGLGKCAKVMGLPQQKQTGGRALITLFAIPNKRGKFNHPLDYPDEWIRYKEYCKQDVETEREVHHQLDHVEFNSQEYVEDFYINRRGFLVDMRLVDAALLIIDDIKTHAYEALQKMTGLNNPNSGPQFRGWLSEKLGIEVSSISKENIGPLYKMGDAHVRAAIRLKQKLSLSSLSKYNTAKLATNLDGRIRGCLQYYGARTGRWAGRLMQLHNLKQNNLPAIHLAREIVRSDPDPKGMLSFLWTEPAKALSQLIRTVLIAPQGRILNVADFSAIEARITSWFAQEHWRLDIFNTHGKIYEASAAKMFGVHIDDVDDSMRKKGKVCELALGFGGSVGALKRMGAEKIGLTEIEMEKFVKVWRKASPSIVDLWYKTEDAFRETVKTGKKHMLKGLSFQMECDGALSITLLSGRKIFYQQPHMIVDEKGRENIAYMGIHPDTKQWVELTIWGGKIVENIAQATARDCLAITLHKLKHLDILVHVHDEVVVESDDKDLVLYTILAIMSESIDWAPGLKLTAAGFRTPFYMKEEKQ